MSLRTEISTATKIISTGVVSLWLKVPLRYSVIFNPTYLSNQYADMLGKKKDVVQEDVTRPA